jgi:quinoprotein relay system zinc metallohydrolase 2
MRRRAASSTGERCATRLHLAPSSLVICRHCWRRLCLVAALGFGLLARGAGSAPLSLENPAAGVYVHYGQQALSRPDNRGDIANFGFVVGARCVAVIDTGGSIAIGRALLAAIRSVTALPVCYVINTHGHPDHVLGNPAFRGESTEFVGHARLDEALRRRGPFYLRAAQRELGAAIAGSEIVGPTRLVTTVDRLDLGGRVLVVRAWPPAHTDQDLTVDDETSGTLWLGDLVFVGHLPVVDGSLRGFVAASEELKSHAAQFAIPGHGRITSWPQALAPQQEYLRRLLADVRAAIAERKTLAQAVESVRLDQPGAWLLADAFHARNVTAAYAELEWEP